MTAPKQNPASSTSPVARVETSGHNGTEPTPSCNPTSNTTRNPCSPNAHDPHRAASWDSPSSRQAASNVHNPAHPPRSRREPVYRKNQASCRNLPAEPQAQALRPDNPRVNNQ